MKTLTISVTDDVYQRASEKAAAANALLPDVVEDLLTSWTQQERGFVPAPVENHRRTDWLKFLDDLAARPLKPGSSVGPLNREELYQRGVSGH
jgi:hypothetical protein